MVGAEGGVASQRPNGSTAIFAGGDSQFRCSHHGESGNYGDYPRGHAVCTGPDPGMLGPLIEVLRSRPDYPSPSRRLIHNIQADVRRYGDIRLVVGGAVMMFLGLVALPLIPRSAPEACGSAAMPGEVTAQLPRRLQVLSMPAESTIRGLTGPRC